MISDHGVIASEMNETTTDDNAFVMDNAMYKLDIHDDCLHLKCIKTKQSYPHPMETLNKFIQLSDVISTSYGKDEWRVDQEGKPLLEYNFFSYYFSSSSCFALTIHYWIKKQMHLRKLLTIKLQTLDKNYAEMWHEMIIFKTNEFTARNEKTRPKNLLMIINPYAGKKKSKYIYEEIVSPLLKKADIETTVTFTEHKQHAVKYLESADLSEYDGVVAVGGDGTFNEVVHGVLINEQKKKDIPLERKDCGNLKPVPYCKPPFRIGLIPAGSGNALSFTTQGTDDVETATLHIICGESHPFDVTSVHDENGELLRFTILGLNYGFFSETLQLSEKMRIFGVMRYKLASLLLFAKLRCYPGQVSYLLSSPENPVNVASETSKCRYPCRTCCDQLNPSLHDEASESDLRTNQSEDNSCESFTADDSVSHKTVTKRKSWPSEFSDLKLEASVKRGDAGNSSQENKLIDHACCSSTRPNQNEQLKVSCGPFLMVTLMNTACRYNLSPTGFVPSAHLADGTNDLILVHKTSRKNFLAYSKASLGPGNHFDFPFVEIHRVKTMHFCALKRDPTSVNVFKKSVESQTSSKDFEDSSEPLEPSCWVSDGEKLKNLDVTTWIHTGLIDIFARGLESD